MNPVRQVCYHIAKEIGVLDVDEVLDLDWKKIREWAEVIGGDAKDQAASVNFRRKPKAQWSSDAKHIEHLMAARFRK